ncbi:ABC transporter permease [uncultured Dysgonomonas sp.]|uniref:ABC3 transporter permease protein domain-containing protein n=1 Tax=uncultured Dysgonomonas sp. TaxID=206096 RepID=A0A212JGR5_9BACT|nr:ABC transporter permease [uncultured Dysgonomonas sp.]SBV98649.1 conserved membrane hypothetical protein [uncultured Dysgonomonas sp.]
MYKIYFKQAIKILKQNKFISIITITGTALAIMMIMAVVVTEAIKHVSVAPEVNRNRTMYIKNSVKNGKNTEWMQSDNVSYELYKNYLSDLQSPEYISAINVSDTEFMVNSRQSEGQILTKVQQVDAAYWRIMSFNFTAGKPFTQEEFASGIQNAIITENLAKKLFGNNEALGQEIEIDFKSYKITGIVKNVSQAFKFAYGEAYIPYTTKKGYEHRLYFVLFLMKDKSDMPKAEEEVRAAERKYNAADAEWNLTFLGPYNHRLQILNKWSNEGPDVEKTNKKMIFIFSMLLLIPAVNLSSFSMSRVNRRTEEIGVRKAFGAKKYIILIQILYENFITSLIGGIIGLLLSYITVTALKEWLLDIGTDSTIPINALISIPVFLGVFIACFLLNLLSAGLPAYRASKKNIVDSINKKNT